MLFEAKCLKIEWTDQPGTMDVHGPIDYGEDGCFFDKVASQIGKELFSEILGPIGRSLYSVTEIRQVYEFTALARSGQKLVVESR